MLGTVVNEIVFDERIKEVYTYNPDGLLTIDESYYQNAGTEHKVVIHYDAKGRRIRSDHYLTVGAMEFDSYTIYRYSGGAGISGPDLLAEQVIVSSANGLLLVNSPSAETITVYSMSGTQVQAARKSTGEAQISIGNLSKGIYIVKGGSGWVKMIKK